MKYKYLFFDLDNTILDFDASEAFALRKSFNDYDIPFQEEFEEVYHTINKQCWRRFEQNELTLAELKPLRMELTLKELQLDVAPVPFSETYHDNLGQTTFFIANSRELIQELAPNYELILITNGIEKIQKSRLQKTGIDSYFSEIVISETIGVSKPDAGFFDHAFEQIKYPPKDQVLVIGDSLSSDIKGGNNYGVDTCWHNFKNIENDRNIYPTYEINQMPELKHILNPLK